MDFVASAAIMDFVAAAARMDFVATECENGFCPVWNFGSGDAHLSGYFDTGLEI
jgi:hypothetical protein